MIDTSFLHHLDRLSLIVNKRITSNFAGEHETSSVGRGLIFRDHNIYVPGDDFRTIDWKVFARTDKLFVKRYEEERNLIVHIVVDFSGSMGFGKKTKKSEYASMMGIGFAYMAMKNNEKFVLSTFADKLELFSPKKGRKQVVAILDYLNKRKPKGHSNLAISLAKYKRLVSSRSLLVVISDFLYDLSQIQDVLYRYKNHEVIFVQVLDEIETKLELDGDINLVDSETKDRLRTYVSPRARKDYLDKLDHHRKKIKKACEEVGARFFSFSTDYPVFDAFYHILRGR